MVSLAQMGICVCACVFAEPSRLATWLGMQNLTPGENSPHVCVCVFAKPSRLATWLGMQVPMLWETAPSVQCKSWTSSNRSVSLVGCWNSMCVQMHVPWTIHLMTLDAFCSERESSQTLDWLLLWQAYQTRDANLLACSIW